MTDVSDVDLSKLPTGQLGWAALVEYAAESDDRVERYFLEVKSDVDPSSARGRAKVAKFILGAANRDPARAAARFGGYAVMLLGVGRGTARGIEPFEAKDLANAVRRLIGADGPAWDFESIRAEVGRDVIAIHVAPPTGDIFTCRADGDGLNDGDIYVRADGETRKANGDEVRLMLERARRQAPDVDVSVEVLGEVGGLVIDSDLLADAVAAEASRLRALAEPSNPYFRSFAGVAGDIRGKDVYLAEVEQWREAAVEDPEAGVRVLAAHMVEGIRVKVSNRTRRYLRGVRIELEFDDPVRAVGWESPEDIQQLAPYPDAPVDWGEKTLAMSLMPSRAVGPAAFRPVVTHGIPRIVEARPARVSMPMDDLRPEEVFVSGDDGVVVVILAESVQVESVTVRWRMTAEDVHEVFSGSCPVPVAVRDWREPLRKWILGPEASDESEPGLDV